MRAKPTVELGESDLAMQLRKTQEHAKAQALFRGRRTGSRRPRYYALVHDRIGKEFPAFKRTPQAVLQGARD